MAHSIIIALIYIVGYFVSYWMLMIENTSEGNVLTKGMKAVAVLTSLLSWITVIGILVVTWIKAIAATGYWQKPVRQVTELTTVNDKANAA